MTTCIDVHQHFWDLARNDYGWLKPDLRPLYRSFGPSDLAPLREQAGVACTVVVQAAPTVEETRYLLDLARGDASIAGVVGWVPLLERDAPALIANLKRDAKFKGVRPMLQDIPDDNWIANPALAPAIEALIEHDLAFDALILIRHVDALEAFATRFPALRIVIDHGAKPPIHMGCAGWQPWADGIARLAQLPHVYCKLSGLATVAGDGWTEATLRPYVDHLIASFGTRRLMWGSDWPVVNLNGDYLRWHSVAIKLLDGLFDAEREAIFGVNAMEFYRLVNA
ncbi:amidohydrolase family protein [Burkholderia pseudomallei]|uniref:amidohydrolase family protein n=1 Tax=Burkholderia pseudomallei TaxID=28450 RepID=UPI0009759B7C|nr:amidohydrolase family protein [Burkholderia pseudomallei]MBD2939881.1 amidohydrolase family protein [Burkholderia pseudomallei]MBD2962798.1 amidohydrolase family protein [Burkholderia pseudomallei]MBF3496460.1 amidohydrolase family protein [Burkholderia pseudomallei]MBF3519554.1 amidohydrolase family protein [Burkholderia pseudomallei]MBF4018191.1 amidohydrolase family protein [Burkholderia pseudomallei]